MKCKFEHGGDCCNSGSPQYMCKCKPDVCGSAVPMTNADCIRGMSDEELAEFICGSTYCQDCPHCGECDNNGGLLNWLQQPAEEGD
nr:MAG TPA: hypothetical protein [Caudoviricetes sp.]